MKFKKNWSSLSVANSLMRKGEYAAAIMAYTEYLNEFPVMRDSVALNLTLAQFRLGTLPGLLPSNSGNGDGSGYAQIEDVRRVGWRNKSPGIPRISAYPSDETYCEYVEHKKVDGILKCIAFYLPQFHPFPENDKWWGKGFTEWTNVGKAEKNYLGHYQPHCPIHNGYYDLRVIEVMIEQARLAKNYGIYGFCYYFYWFGGKTLLEAPLINMLNTPAVDIPFCLAWANENWTRRWDGQESDVLMAQNHSSDDSLSFIRHLGAYFSDPRYIKIGGRPVLIVYRADIIPDISATLELWRNEAELMGYPGLHLVCAQTFGIESPERFGFDAAMEFPPHTVVSAEIQDQLVCINSKFAGKIYSYDQVVDNALRDSFPKNYARYRTAMLSWDNTARKQNASHIFHGFTIGRYKQWLNGICVEALKNESLCDDGKFVFINAWNEWAEGTHLEPDQKFGYRYLQATRDVVGELSAFRESLFCSGNSGRSAGCARVAVLVHLFYVDLWLEIAGYLKNFCNVEFDLYVTVTVASAIPVVHETHPEAIVTLVENRGRDVLPFIEQLRAIHGCNYEAVCKLHSKKSEYRSDGAVLRGRLFDSLVGDADLIESITAGFFADKSLGLVVPDEFYLEHNDLNMTYNFQGVADIAGKVGVEFRRDRFPAGSMFWFRQSALSRLLLLGSQDFEVEDGLADGTEAHAVERMFGSLVEGIGYSIRRSSGFIGLRRSHG